MYFSPMISITVVGKNVEFLVLIKNSHSNNVEIFKLFLIFRVNFDSDPNPNLLGFGSGSERSRIRIRIGLNNRIRI
jgi:hypothetical protein